MNYYSQENPSFTVTSFLQPKHLVARTILDHYNDLFRNVATILGTKVW